MTAASNSDARKRQQETARNLTDAERFREEGRVEVRAKVAEIHHGVYFVCLRHAAVDDCVGGPECEADGCDWPCATAVAAGIA